jgi:hypothetical protein
MTNFTLHFDAEPGMDAVAVARQLQERCAKLAEIEDARSKAMRDRAFGVDDILLVLTISTELLTAGALSLEALKRLIIAAKGVAEELGLKKVTVEGDGARVRPEELTDADVQFIAASARPAP